MHDRLLTLANSPYFRVENIKYDNVFPSKGLDVTITGYLSSPLSTEPINELQNMNTKLVSQSDYIETIKSGGNYIVGSVDSLGCLSFAQNPAYHRNAALARAECKRLAKLSPGKLYIFIRLDGGEMVPTSSISI